MSGQRFKRPEPDIPSNTPVYRALFLEDKDKKNEDGKSFYATQETSTCTTVPVLCIFLGRILLIWRWRFNNWPID